MQAEIADLKKELTEDISPIENDDNSKANQPLIEVSLVSSEKDCQNEDEEVTPKEDEQTPWWAPRNRSDQALFNLVKKTTLKKI